MRPPGTLSLTAHRRASRKTRSKAISPTPLTPELAEELGRALLAKPALGRHLNQITKWLGRPIDWVGVFELARQARNAIAQETVLGIVRDVESTAGRPRRLAELGERVRWVALVDLGVCLLVETLACEELPPQQSTATYAARMVSWVCDVEEEP